tara:strand:+ start:3162 stop:4517 length:1356 start_codon:yes stop_codon:yes gene_type:complete
MKVIKSGGESTGTAEKIKILTNHIQSIPETIVLVISAPATENYRVTELLKNNMEEKIEEIFKKITKELNIDFKVEWEKGLHIGEHIHSQIIAKYFQSQNINAVWIDAREAIEIQNNKITNIKKELFKNYQVYVIGGFYGTENNTTVTLPIGGSDITAGAIAGFLKVDEYQNLKEFPGVAVVDPKYIENTKIIQQATYAEIREAVYRSKKSLLEPTSLEHCKKNKIPIRIKSLTEKGETLITNCRESTPPLTSIACKEGFTTYTFENTPLLEVINKFTEKNISIDMINKQHNTTSVTIHDQGDQALISIVGEGISKPITFTKWIKTEIQPTTVYGPILDGLETDMTTFYIELFGMNSIIGYAKKLIQVFKNNNISIDAVSTTIDSFSIGTKKEITNIKDICKQIDADIISVTKNGIHLFGPNKDVRNITIAIPENQTKQTIEKIYKELKNSF